MKRDARIGLAVVLVLGLAVTLLIGRALYKSTPVAEANPDDGAETSTAAASEDIHRVEGANVAAPAPMPSPAPAPAAIHSDASNDARAEMVNLPPEHEQTNTAVQQFVQNQTRPIHEPEHAVLPSPNAPRETAGNHAAPHGSHATTNGNPHEELLGDHEAGPVKTEELPTDGFGYTVASGDNIWKISSKVYGDGKFTQKIVEANKDTNTAKLKVGQVIRIPIIQNKTILMKLPSFADASKPHSNAAEPAAAAHNTSQPVAASRATPVARAEAPHTETASASAPVEATTHKVEAGETLGAIAKKYYGTAGPKTIAKIVEANKGLDPAKLKVGQEIAIPAKK
jgi:nucleoid-associated protein YgaU